MSAPLKFSRFTAPTSHGPEIAVAREDIVAVEMKYDPLTQKTRSVLHLRGGSSLPIDTEYTEAVRVIYPTEEPQP